MMGITLPLLSAAVSRAGAQGQWHQHQPALRDQHARRDDRHAAEGIDPDPGNRHQRSFLLAATLNVMVGAIALWFRRSRNRSKPDTTGYQGADIPDPMVPAFTPDRLQPAAVDRRSRFGLRLARLGDRLVPPDAAIRVATTEAFTAMLTTVLGGIAIGGLIAAWILRSRAIIMQPSASSRRSPASPAVCSMSFFFGP